MQWPHEILPTEALVYTPVPTATVASPMSSNNTNDAPVGIPSSISSSSEVGTTKKPFTVERTLDEASGGRILAYHYRRGDGSGVTESRSSTQQQKIQVNAKSQFAESFYIPEQTPRRAAGEASVRFWDVLADKLQWTTSNNVQLISLAWLVENSYTVRELLLDCEIKISELVSANILQSFADLLKLKFRVADLKCARLLFDCKDLRTLFSTTCRCVCGLRRNPRPGASCHCTVLGDFGLGVNVAEEPYFYAQELVTLDYSLGETVEECAIKADMLQALNYAPADLRALGLGRRHLRQLQISRDRGLRARTDRRGFAWSAEEWDLFV
jgi:hypothetical protein